MKKITETVSNACGEIFIVQHMFTSITPFYWILRTPLFSCHHYHQRNREEMSSRVVWPRGLASDLELHSTHIAAMMLSSAYICESQFPYLLNGGNNHSNFIEFLLALRIKCKVYRLVLGTNNKYYQFLLSVSPSCFPRHLPKVTEVSNAPLLPFSLCEPLSKAFLVLAFLHDCLLQPLDVTLIISLATNWPASPPWYWIWILLSLLSLSALSIVDVTSGNVFTPTTYRTRELSCWVIYQWG